MYARIEAGAVAAYPVDLRAEQPNTSFPWDWPGGVVNGVEYARVRPVDVPQVDHTQNFSEGTPALIDGAWTQIWIVTDATPEQIAEREAEHRRHLQVSPRQLRLALLEMDLLDAVEAAVAQADRATQIMWEYSTIYERAHPAWEQMAAQLDPPRTMVEVDAVFRLAATF